MILHFSLHLSKCMHRHLNNSRLLVQTLRKTTWLSKDNNKKSFQKFMNLQIILRLQLKALIIVLHFQVLNLPLKQVLNLSSRIHLKILHYYNHLPWCKWLQFKLKTFLYYKSLEVKSDKSQNQLLFRCLNTVKLKYLR